MSTSWEPTNELRFVRRKNMDPNVLAVQMILQQKWIIPSIYTEYAYREYKQEWRDVEVVEE